MSFDVHCVITVLTCVCSELGLALIFPDTSPRGYELEDGRKRVPCLVDDGFVLSFYLDATTPEWSPHMNMYTYINSELPTLIASEFVWFNPDKLSIMGFSMGGHGAVMHGLRNPESYKSVSAMSPGLRATTEPFPRMAFHTFLKDPEEEGKQYCCYSLVKAGHKGPVGAPILVMSGANDPVAVHGGDFIDACAEMGVELDVRWPDDQSHTFLFVGTYIEEHLRFHAEYLTA